MKQTPYKEKLKSHNIQQKDLARACGVDERTVRRWMKNNKMPFYAFVIFNILIDKRDIRAKG